jgi:cytochrome c556
MAATDIFKLVMADAGAAALAAANARNLDALVAANGQVVESCEGCHKEFKPDLPTEGIVHTHDH